MYAQRMTKLYAPTNDYAPSEDVLHLVNLDQSKQPLIPRLQLLNWTTGRLFLPWLHLLLPPSLSEIHIDLNGGSATPVNVAVIKALPTTHLQHVAFSTVHTNPEVDAALLELILASRHLKSVYIQQETSSEGLRGGGIEEQTELEDLTSIIIPFKNEPTFLQSLFDRATLPNIRQIYLQHSGKTEWSNPDGLFDSVLRSASPRVLHALRYTSHYHGIDITSARIRLLQSFTALRTVRVTSLCGASGCKFFLCDEDISIIANAMPNLVELHLGGTPCSSTLVNVSMTSLATLATNCTKIRDLQIHFDTAGFINRVLDVPAERPIPPRATSSSCQLTQLSVGRIPLNRAMDGYWVVGMALLQIFPNLTNIKCHQPQLGLGGREWGEVMRIVRVQRNVVNSMSGASDGIVRVRVSNTKPV